MLFTLLQFSRKKNQKIAEDVLCSTLSCISITFCF